MPKIKLDPAKAYGWGRYSYMLRALSRKEDGSLYVERLKVRHTNASHQNEEEAIRDAEKYSTIYWAELVYFCVPMKTARFGELRNKAFTGFSVGNQPFQRFQKPLKLFEALEKIEEMTRGEKQSERN